MRSVSGKLFARMSLCRSRVMTASYDIYHLTRDSLDVSPMWQTHAAGLVSKIRHLAHGR